MLAACSALFFVWLPSYRGLLWLTLYTIPSHMFISPLPHEPVLLYFAKVHGATLCTEASTVGCLLAGMWDYWLFVPLMHHPRVRAKYADVGLYRRSVRWFRKSPFWALVVLGATPLPFYPIKFLSITDHYPMRKYLLALFVGRAPRYWVIAYLGYTLRLPNWSLALLALAIFIVTVIQTHREEKRKAREQRDPSIVPDSAEVNPSRAGAQSRPSGKQPSPRFPRQ